MQSTTLKWRSSTVQIQYGPCSPFAEDLEDIADPNSRQSRARICSDHWTDGKRKMAVRDGAWRSGRRVFAVNYLSAVTLKAQRRTIQGKKINERFTEERFLSFEGKGSMKAGTLAWCHFFKEAIKYLN